MSPFTSCGTLTVLAMAEVLCPLRPLLRSATARFSSFYSFLSRIWPSRWSNDLSARLLSIVVWYFSFSSPLSILDKSKFRWGIRTPLCPTTFQLPLLPSLLSWCWPRWIEFGDLGFGFQMLVEDLGVGFGFIQFLMQFVSFRLGFWIRVLALGFWFLHFVGFRWNLWFDLALIWFGCLLAFIIRSKETYCPKYEYLAPLWIS